MTRTPSPTLISDLVSVEIRIQRRLQQLSKDGKSDTEYKDLINELQKVQGRLYTIERNPRK